MQTHLGTVPISVCLLALAAVGFWRNRAGSLRVPIIVAGGLLTLIWIGPLVQEVTNTNGNLTLIAKFYAHPPHVDQRTHSLTSSLIVVGNHATVVPLGTATDAYGHAARLLAAAALAVLGLFAAYVARRRAPFIAALALTTTIGLLVAVIAASRVIGPQDGFLFYWTEALPIPALVAGVWLALERAHAEHGDGSSTSRPRSSSWWRSRSRCAPSRGPDRRPWATPQPRARSRNASNKKSGRRIVRSRSPSRRRRVDAGVIAVQLDKDGYRFHLNPPVNLYAGNVSENVTRPAFILRSVSLGAPPDATARLVATFGPINLFVER